MVAHRRWQIAAFTANAHGYDLAPEGEGFLIPATAVSSVESG